MAARKVAFVRDAPKAQLADDVEEYNARRRTTLVDDASARVLNPRTHELATIPASLVEAAEARSPFDARLTTRSSAASRGKIRGYIQKSKARSISPKKAFGTMRQKMKNVARR